LSEKAKARESRERFVMKHLQLKNLTPHLLTALAPIEEQVRTQLGWQAFDQAIHLLSYGTQDELKPFVSLPKEVASLRKKAVIICSDQVPVWVKVQTKKELFLNSEYKSKEIETVRKNIQKSILSNNENDTAIVVSKPGVGEKVVSGQRQLRTNRNSQDDKVRWTYEARQEVHQYFDPEKVPFGVQGKGAIVFSGTHARLSNIDKRGCWIRDETFRIGEKEVTRLAGQRVGRILASVRELRDGSAEGEALINEFSDVYSQPGATVDTIIQCWIIEEQALRLPVSLALRDCLGATFTSDAVEAKFIGNQLETHIPAKTTSFLQPTDTDFSRQFKALSRKKMDSLRQLEEAIDTDDRKTFTPQFKHIFESLAHAQRELASKDWVLPSLRRNGWLIWRPPLSICFIINRDLLQFDL
jgi:hypothetical protein